MRRLELGSGNRPRLGYEHLDFRSDLPDVDHVHDLSNSLPFESKEFDEVLADQVFEHFSWFNALDKLRDWTRVLKVGGKLVILVPDLRYICQQYINGTGTSNISRGRKPHLDKGLGAWNSSTCTVAKLFGGQDYEGNFHFAAYDASILSNMFKQIGLKHIVTDTHTTPGVLKVTGVRQ